jgi:hypothetical protein
VARYLHSSLSSPAWTARSSWRQCSPALGTATARHGRSGRIWRFPSRSWGSAGAGPRDGDGMSWAVVAGSSVSIAGVGRGAAGKHGCTGLNPLAKRCHEQFSLCLVTKKAQACWRGRPTSLQFWSLRFGCRLR